MSTKKRRMPRGELILQVLIFSLGFFYAFVYYVNVPTPVDLQAVSDQLFAYLTAMLTAAFAIGIINLTRVHVNNVKRKRPAWGYSIILIVSLYGMAIVSMISSPFAVDPTGAVIPGAIIDAVTPIWEFLYYKILVTINSSIFSLLAFFIASAAYRAFKAKTLEATILLVAGLLVVLGQAPIMDLVSPSFSAIRSWILLFPNTAGQRGILIGAALGILAFSVRRLIRYPWGR
jgi:hypothetical protein